MAVAVVAAPVEPRVGQQLAITITGLTVSGNAKITIASEDGGGLMVSGTFAADGAGALTLVGKMDVIPLVEGHVNVSVFDVTAVTTTVLRIKVDSEA